jgi:hypothetical protein
VCALPGAQIRFAQPVVARFLRLRVLAEVKGSPFAALAELDVLLDGGGEGGGN